MSVIIYKDGEPLKVEPQSLHNHLAMGYSLSPDGNEDDVEIELTEEGIAELRELAKEAGIQNWHNKKPENLLEELNAV